jgi:DNA (cytosine-5)-methyltransferase 1
MGYKLAGFDHLGGVEIDPQVAAVYKANHSPKHLFVEDIRDFVKREELPTELFDLDLLDGSPPCSSFSMAGNREKDWGKEKVFREGQAKQRLDDLFFDYIELAKRLQPKVVIAENVKGMLQGNAKAYVKRVKAEFEAAGYVVQLFLLNAASMGVPQKRERVFFVCQRKDMGWPRLVLNFNENGIAFGDVDEGDITYKQLSEGFAKDWRESKIGGSVGKFFSNQKVDPALVLNTIASGTYKFHWKYPRELTDSEFAKCGSYPLDYNFQKVEPKYLIGMSVPPVMTAQVAHQVYLQWLSKTGQKQGT